MKKYIQQLSVEQPVLRERLKHVGQMFTGQALFQILGFGTSVLIIRNASKEDYGTYTIILSIQMLIAAMSSSGMMAGYQKIGSRVWDKNAELSKLYYTATNIRIKIFLLALVAAFAYGAYAFTHAGYSYGETAVYLVISGILAYPSVHLPFLEYIYLLKKNIVDHQKISIIDKLLKFLLVVFLLYVLRTELHVSLLAICTIIPAYAGLAFAYKRMTTVRQAAREVDPAYQETMMSYVRKNWHNSVFYAFKHQIAIIILASVGSVEQVASLGALSRFNLVLGMLATVFNSTFGIIFAKEIVKEKALKSYVFYVGVAVAVSVVALFVASLITPWLLFILGDEYANLDQELLLTLASGFIGVLVTMTHMMNTAKGWIHYSPILEIPLSVLTIVASIFLFDLSSLGGVIKMGLLSTLSLLFLTLFNAVHGFKHWNQ